MRTLTFTLLILVFAIGTTSPAWASDRVILRDGSVKRGKILEVTENGVRVQFSPKGGGSAQMNVPPGRLDPHWFYNLRDSKIGNDAKGRLKLAMWAFEEGMFSRAKVQVEQAAEIDPKLVKDIREGALPDIREGIANRMLESAQGDIKDGALDRADEKLQILLARMPDTEAGTAAVDVYKALQDQIRGKEAREEQERLDQMAEEERKAKEERDRLLRNVDRDLDRAKRDFDNGLTEDRESRALSLLGNAIRHAGSALRRIDRLEQSHADNKFLMDDIAERRTKTIAGMVTAHLRRADIYTWRSSTSNARKEIEAARKLDPDNPAIAEAEARADQQDDQDVLDLRWTRNRREDTRFRGGGQFAGARGGGGRRR